MAKKYQITPPEKRKKLVTKLKANGMSVCKSDMDKRAGCPEQKFSLKSIYDFLISFQFWWFFLVAAIVIVVFIVVAFGILKVCGRGRLKIFLSFSLSHSHTCIFLCFVGALTEFSCIFIMITECCTLISFLQYKQ